MGKVINFYDAKYNKNISDMKKNISELRDRINDLFGTSSDMVYEMKKGDGRNVKK